MTEYAKSSSVAERSGDVGFIFEENNAESSSDSFTYSFTSRAELGCFPITLDSKAEWLDFLELSLADWLEQVEGAAEKANPLFEWKVGEAWSYRREAYRCMASVLQTNRRSDVYVRMWEQVYAQEGPLTRGLSQPVTPPVSQAAREAREAMQARHIWCADIIDTTDWQVGVECKIVSFCSVRPCTREYALSFASLNTCYCYEVLYNEYIKTFIIFGDLLYFIVIEPLH